MTRLNLNDLPHNVRERVEAKLEAQGTPVRGTSRSRTKKKGPTAGVDVVCKAPECGIRLTSEAAMNRHCDATGHGRYEIEL